MLTLPQQATLILPLLLPPTRHLLWALLFLRVDFIMRELCMCPPTSGEVDIQQPDYGHECNRRPLADFTSKSPLRYSSPPPQMSPLMDSPSSTLSTLESPALVCKSSATSATIQGRPPMPDIATIASIFRPPPVKTTAGSIGVDIIKQPVVPAQQAAETSAEKSSAPVSSGSSSRCSKIWNYFLAIGDGRIAKM